MLIFFGYGSIINESENLIGLSSLEFIIVIRDLKTSVGISVDLENRLKLGRLVNCRPCPQLQIQNVATITVLTWEISTLSAILFS